MRFSMVFLDGQVSVRSRVSETVMVTGLVHIKINMTVILDLSVAMSKALTMEYWLLEMIFPGQGFF